MKRSLLLLACACLLIIITKQNAFAQSGIYGGGPIYKNRSYSINELKNSGFTYVVVWTIHIDAAGTLNFNAEFPLVQNGSYTGASSYPNFASDVASLKTGTTSIRRVEFGLSAWGSSTFANIRNLINSQGTGSSSILYRNFQALRNTFPTIDALNFDDESTYDASSATAFAVMLADLGFKVTLCPYTQQTFWTNVATSTNNQRPGTVDRIDLQCYAGGAGNNPCNWNFGSINVSCGLWDQEKTTSQVTSQLTTWKNNCGIDAGFIWLYDDIDNSSATAAYAAAVNNAFGGGATAAATFYKDCNYGGTAVGLQPGSYNLSQLNAAGILNDDISSLRVRSGYRVTMYWDNNFAGSTLQKTGDDACLVDDGWNDKVSSLVIAAAAAPVAVVSNASGDVIVAPGKSELQVQGIVGNVQVMDISGRVLFREMPVGNRVDIGRLKPGVYLLMYNVNGKAVTRRFVK